jgi:hypothetical protein
MTRQEHNLSSDSTPVAKQPQTTALYGAQQLDSLCSEIVLCGSALGTMGLLFGVRTRTRL